MTAPVEVQEPLGEELTVTDKPWIVIVSVSPALMSSDSFARAYGLRDA